MMALVGTAQPAVCENLSRGEAQPTMGGLVSRSDTFLAVFSLALFFTISAADATTSYDFGCDPTRPLNVNSGARATLHPGTYGNVLLKMKSVVTLEPGVYTVCDWSAGRGSDVITVDGVEIRSVERFRVDNESTFGPVCTVPVVVQARGYTKAKDISVNFSKGNTISGAFHSQGPIGMGNNNDLTGTFDAPFIRSVSNVRIHPCP